jgi:hypothetical protein
LLAVRALSKNILNVTRDLNTRAVVSKRAIFGNCVSGMWEGCGDARLGSETAGFYEGVKDFVGEDIFIV